MTTGMTHYQRLFGTRPTSRYCQPAGVDRPTLPTPLSYLTGNGLLTRKPRGEWAAVRCPVHKSGNEKHPSMQVSLVTGGFRCLACGEKGGDVIALHMLRTGLRFREAVHDLGARFHDE